ncbi:MAG: hypothetical protein ACREPJ_13220, partial [Rhodanobacteraceae bacterium]
ARRYRGVLQAWQVVDFTTDIAQHAARRRALSPEVAGGRPACQRLSVNADALVTHDRDFDRVRGLRILA